MEDELNNFKAGEEERKLFRLEEDWKMAEEE